MSQDPARSKDFGIRNGEGSTAGLAHGHQRQRPIKLVPLQGIVEPRYNRVHPRSRFDLLSSRERPSDGCASLRLDGE
jgi:hypothetical protein